MEKLDILKNLTFGARVAEEEKENLKHYFVKTDQWKKIFSGEIDIIYGPKGSGKSAIYSFLSSSENELFERNILMTPAENPRGTPAFKDLNIDPPASEEEFVKLWKIYILLITGVQIKEFKLKDESSIQLIKKLEECKLIPRRSSLSAYLKNSFDYVKGLTRPESIQPGIEVGESGMPTNFNFKITFREPTDNEIDNGFISIDELFEVVNSAMTKNNLTLWIALDRLDVAFSENSELEKNALRALFKVYLDLIPNERIRLKIFLRDDIWQRITDGGFREASHITKHTTIKWNRESILNLIIRRLLNNNDIVSFYKTDVQGTLSDIDRQTQLFYRIFPYKIGNNEKSKSIDWIISRTRDGKGTDSPREIIHLLNQATDIQIKSMEIGKSNLENKELLDDISIKKSLNEVSKVRIETAIFAEYPLLKEFILKLMNEKSQLAMTDLQGAWSRNRKNAMKIALELVQIGFFERHGPKDEPYFIVPYLYRPYLNMT
ncbi:MAG: hypothetical protein Q8L81_08290 [Bacteroidota bacterium]|nr:hypothetical protein [Bacteroidota bacterium]